MKKNFLKKSLPDSWSKVLKHHEKLESLSKPEVFISSQLNKKINVLPKRENIFRAFEYCSFKDANVVIFGQDPYFQSGIANGLAFSANSNNAIPHSLKNIFKEVKNDIGSLSNNSGDLTKWACQGVLLLNSALTVEENKPRSHSKIGWHEFIYDVIYCLNKKQGIVFMLWGNDAKKYFKKINKDNNLVLTSSHPSPLSAYKGFFGCKHFSKCNNYLIENNKTPIQW
ncbi:MAG: uracil-DNA glycosylase [Gammaproteobacteria bacterium]|nr:uracil-DNA glycosylase [Gammaproteobacteria bacterium]|tara:strand:- start:10993 stop:11670 length:678 start_codon:yes stop_codon:yes gene_type:complete